MFKPNQSVIVIDNECKLHRQTVTIVRSNPRNTAEWEVKASDGATWIVHSCRLRAIPVTRWQPFSVEELRRLQEVLSNNIENIHADCVDDDGQQTVSTDLDEAMLEEVLTEINQRLVVA